MADYLTLLKKGPDLVGLKDDFELITALVEVFTKWPEMKPITGFDTAEKFLADFIGQIGNPAVRQALVAANKTELVALYDKLLGLLNKLKAKVGKVPEDLQTLLNPMSTYNGAGAASKGIIDWTPIDETKKFGDGGDFSFEIGGNAKLALIAADEVDTGGGKKKKLLRIGADLGVNAKAGATPPFQPLKVEGKFEASAGASIAYHFDTGPGDPLYVVALAECLPALPNPFDYDAVWRAFARKELGFTRLSYKVNGKSKASADLSIGNKASFGKALVVDLSLTFGADFSLSADYVLTLTAGPPLPGGDANTAPREIVATLSRSRATDAGLDFGIKVNLDLSQAAKRIQDEVKKAVAKWDSLLKEVEPFLSPGTLLQTTLSKELGERTEALIKDPELRAAVNRSLRTVIGIDEDDDDDVLEWLSKRIAGAIDSVEGAITEQTDKTVDLVLGQLSEIVPAFAQDQIRAKVEPLIAGLIDDAKGKLDELVKKLFDTRQEELRDALKDVGVKAADAVATLDKALESVRKVVKNFDKLIHDTLKELQNSARAQITVALSAEERWHDETKMEIAGAFTADSKKAASVFHALTRGKLNELQALLSGDDPDDDFRLDPDKSKLTRYAKRTSKIAWQAVFFGFGASGSTIAEGDARVVLDGRGTVHVDSSAKIENEFIGRSEQRKVTLVEGFDLIRARIQSTLPSGGGFVDKARKMDFGVDIVHKDKSLKLGEMRGFLQSLTAQGLLPDEVRGRADTLFQTWAGSADANAHIPADIAVGLHLDAAQLKQLLMLDKRDPATNRLTRQGGITTCHYALENLLAAGAFRFDKARLDEVLKFIRLRFYPGSYPADATAGMILYDMQEPGQDPAGFLAPVWKAQGQLPAEGPPHKGEHHNYVLTNLRVRLHQLVQLIDLMGQIYLAQPIDVDDAPVWDADKYTKKQHQLALAGQGWIKTGGKLLFWIDREVHPWTVALLGTVSRLAKVDPQPGPTMALKLTNRGEGEAKGKTVELIKLD